jgi:hypothetical protein
LLNIDAEGDLTIQLYDKWDDFNFAVSLWQRPSVFLVSFKASAHLVTSFDTQGYVEGLF